MKEIKLTQGKFAIVDDQDFENVNGQKWYFDHFGGREYASRQFSKKTIRMHQFIVGNREGLVVDHIDGNGLNNTRSNLRFVTRSFNVANTPKNKGYYYDKIKKQFICRLRFHRKTYFTGRFKTEIEAINNTKKIRDFFLRGERELVDFLVSLQSNGHEFYRKDS